MAIMAMATTTIIGIHNGSCNFDNRNDNSHKKHKIQLHSNQRANYLQIQYWVQVVPHWQGRLTQPIYNDKSDHNVLKG